MNLYEHQAKGVFQNYGIPIPMSCIVREEAGLNGLQGAFDLIGLDRFGVIKAQVLTGGRGKAGGIKVVHSFEEGKTAFQSIMGMSIKGHTVNRVLVEERLDVKEEYYASIAIDPELQSPILLMSPKGGMDIESVAQKFPDAVGKCPIPSRGVLPSYAVLDLMKKLGFGRALWGGLIDIVEKLYKVFSEKDATLTEINPLIVTLDGQLIAADGRLNVDDNALFRHSDFNQLKAEFKELALKDKGLDYIDLGEGDVGLFCVGAGMTMLTMDLVAQLGGRARCFLDISHGINPTGFEVSLKLLASHPHIRYVLVNMFGGLSQMDMVAKSFVQAMGTLGNTFPKPLVMRIQGTNSEEGRRILREAGYEVYSELSEALNGLNALLKEKL